MTPERYQQIRELARAARNLAKTERSVFLAESCANDAELQREVELFIASAEQVEQDDGFLEKGAMQDMARVIAEQETATGVETTGSGVSSSSDLLSGTTLGGRYQITRQIGEGGLGTVFLANDQKLHDTQVVIKILKKEHCTDEQGSWFENKFRDEIKALSRIDHPGVVRALDTGAMPDGRTFLVMQYIAGVPLRSLIPQQGMELGRAASLIRQIAHALTAAHEQGVIHRDLKPENIMVQIEDGEEHAKLIDFGIASVWEKTNATTAETTQIAGSAGYMAPEQLKGKPSVSSDIYALGIIAYELTTGRRPFNPDTIFEMLELQHKGVKILPSDLRPSLSPAAEQVILKALSFAKTDRHTSAHSFGEEFFRAIQNGDLAVVPTLKQSTFLATPSHRPGVMALVLLSVILLSASGAWIFWKQKTTPVTTQTTQPERQLNFTLVLLRNPKRYPGSSPIELARTAVFDNGDQIRLRITSPQTGYLYIVNEGPTPVGGQPNYNYLFPYALGNNFSAAIGHNQTVQIPWPSDSPELDWLSLTGQKGVEKVWLIWSEHLVAELESVKHFADFQHMGAIKDPNQVNLVAQYLHDHSTNQVTIEEDDLHPQTRLKGKGNVLVGLVKLEHR